MARRIVPLLERLMLSVEPEPNTGCWLWLGMVGDSGYGKIAIGSRSDGSRRIVPTHRLAWELANGPIPHGQCCLHRCDQRLCLSLDHLFLGTRRENQMDMASKWRGNTSRQGLPFGVNKHCNAKLARRYGSRVKFLGEAYWLGLYATPEEASAVAVAFKEKCYREGAPK